MKAKLIFILLLAQSMSISRERKIKRENGYHIFFQREKCYEKKWSIFNFGWTTKVCFLVSGVVPEDTSLESIMVNGIDEVEILYRVRAQPELDLQIGFIGLAIAVAFCVVLVMICVNIEMIRALKKRTRVSLQDNESVVRRNSLALDY